MSEKEREKVTESESLRETLRKEQCELMYLKAEKAQALHCAVSGLFFPHSFQFDPFNKFFATFTKLR